MQSQNPRQRCARLVLQHNEAGFGFDQYVAHGVQGKVGLADGCFRQAGRASFADGSDGFFPRQDAPDLTINHHGKLGVRMVLKQSLQFAGLQ